MSEMKIITGLVAAGIVVSLVAGCYREPKFQIKGSVYGGEGKTMLLSKADFGGRWIAIDSVKIGDNGEFSIKGAAPGAPEVYRLTMGENSIFVPIDSVESITLETSAQKFGTEFKLSGSENAEKMAAFEQELIRFNSTEPAAMDTFKRGIYTRYIQNSGGSIVSYYVLTKVIGDQPLFNPSDAMDAKYYAAVATQYDQFNPGDPHGKMVREASLNAMRRHNSASGKRRVIEANEIKVIDIALPDENGKTVKLSDHVGKGNPTVVVFAMMNAKDSPAFNRELSKFRNSHPGVTIYHVSLDPDQYAWRDAAKNLPWVTVFDANGMTSTALRDYNVTDIPSFYIYNASGDLTDKVVTLEELNRKL